MASAFKLLASVDPKYKCLAVICVIVLYLVPSLYVGWRTYDIWYGGAPALKTQMSPTWGKLPDLFACAKTQKAVPRITRCSLTDFEPENGMDFTPASTSFKDMLKPSYFRKKEGHCLLTNFRNHKVAGTGQLSVPDAGGKSAVYGHCVRLNTSILEPNASWPSSSKILLRFLVTDASVTEMTLRAYDPNGFQLLTYLNAGTTHLVLKKKRIGSMSFQGKNLSSWNTWLGLWSPGLKNDYNVELRSFDPDEDVEKILTPSNSTLQYQVFVLSISIPDKHAVEEIEVGRVPQIIFLLARVGGWMSVLSAILGLCWVQKHPYDPMVVTYEERTLLGTSEPRTQSQK